MSIDVNVERGLRCPLLSMSSEVSEMSSEVSDVQWSPGLVTLGPEFDYWFSTLVEDPSAVAMVSFPVFSRSFFFFGSCSSDTSRNLILARNVVEVRVPQVLQVVEEDPLHAGVLQGHNDQGREGRTGVRHVHCNRSIGWRPLGDSPHVLKITISVVQPHCNEDIAP